MIKLKKHQEIPVDFMKNHNGLILYHSTGSGKTLTALYAMYQFDPPITIIGPKSSKKAFMDNIKKSKLSPSKVTFYSFKKIKNLLEKNIDLLQNKSVIVDEAHNLRTQNVNNLMVVSALKLSFKVVLLTATPVVNYLNDFSVLVNIAKYQDVLPTTRSHFDAIYYNEEANIILNDELLKRKMGNCISYYKQVDDENFPTSETRVLEVVMDTDQLKEYVYYVARYIYDNKEGKDLYYVDFDMVDKKKKNFFLSATRQISNTVNNNPDSPKIKQIFQKIKEGPYPIIVYSNFLKNGIFPLIELLEKSDIAYNTITGDTREDQINMIVNDYNKLKYKVLLLSSAGSESLDLKNTRQIHIMEPHWNLGKLTQVTGRAIRYKSHNMLPKDQRHVAIYRWIGVFPLYIYNESADQYLMRLSKMKQEIFEQFEKIIKEVSIENTYFKNFKGGYYDLYKRMKQKYIMEKNKFIVR